MKVKIGDKYVGEDEPCYVVADIGINHNGDVDIAKQLIGWAYRAGCDAVKFQKRTIEDVYTPEELAKPRESPFGITNGDLKRGLELSLGEYQEIDKYCKDIGMPWYASCWDLKSVDFMEQFNPPCHKVASPMLTYTALLEAMRDTGRPVVLSTGMSTEAQIKDAVVTIGDTSNLIILHCTSTYPCTVGELNLRVIPTLYKWCCPVGYSGHEVGIVTSVVAVALGAKMVERHITLDRSMWGTDQSASVEPLGMERLVKYIHSTEKALGDGVKVVYPSEVPIMNKLRRV